jgi:hypothetical protein
MTAFEHLTPSDFPHLRHFFEGQRYRISVYSLSSLIAWSNDEYRPLRAVENGTLVVAAEFIKDPGKRHLILPIDPAREHGPEALHDLSLAAGIDTFWFVPEDYILRYGKEKIGRLFEFSEQPEFEDYVYRTEDLAALKGNRYAKKRNLIHQFQESHLDRNRVEVAQIAAENAPECIEFLEEWCRERDCDSGEWPALACEKQAAVNMLENIETLETEGIFIRVDGRVSAFGIASRLTPDIHFEKAFASVKGLYQFLDNECAKRLFSKCAYINKESDMSIPGLAKAKSSYHPVMRIKSFRMKRR